MHGKTVEVYFERFYAVYARCRPLRGAMRQLAHSQSGHSQGIVSPCSHLRHKGGHANNNGFRYLKRDGRQ